jgi:hypothetical protein
MKSFNIGDLVRVSLFNLSAEYREIKKSKIGVNKIALNYSPFISKITNIYPSNNNTIYVEQCSIAVGDDNGNPPILMNLLGRLEIICPYYLVVIN